MATQSAAESSRSPRDSHTGARRPRSRQRGDPGGQYELRTEAAFRAGPRRQGRRACSWSGRRYLARWRCDVPRPAQRAIAGLRALGLKSKAADGRFGSRHRAPGAELDVDHFETGLPDAKLAGAGARMSARWRWSRQRERCPRSPPPLASRDRAPMSPRECADVVLIGDDLMKLIRDGAPRASCARHHPAELHRHGAG